MELHFSKLDLMLTTWTFVWDCYRFPSRKLQATHYIMYICKIIVLYSRLKMYSCCDTIIYDSNRYNRKADKIVKTHHPLAGQSS